MPSIFPNNSELATNNSPENGNETNEHLNIVSNVPSSRHQILPNQAHIFPNENNNEDEFDFDFDLFDSTEPSSMDNSENSPCYSNE